MLVGFALALGAAFAYGAASLLQSVGARRAALRTGSLTGLAYQPLYFVGLAFDAIGFAAMLVALQFLPLFVVQTTVSSNVAITALGASLFLGARLGRPAWIAMAAVLVGVVLIGASAQLGESATLAPVWRWVLLVAALPAAALGIWGSRSGRVALVPLAAGLAYSVVVIAARALSFPHPLWRILLDPLLWALAASGVVGTLLFARATQSSAVTRVATITFTTETLLPSAVGVLFLHDSVRPQWWPCAIIGFVLAVVGAVVLTRLTEVDPVPHPLDGRALPEHPTA